MLPKPSDMRRENLAEFTSRVMREKNFTNNQVSRQSRGLISESHISRIQTGAVPTPSAQKLKALARGIQESEWSVVCAALDIAPDPQIVQNERFATLADMYAALAKPARTKIDYLLEAVEREMRHLAEQSRPFQAGSIKLEEEQKTRRKHG